MADDLEYESFLIDLTHHLARHPKTRSVSEDQARRLVNIWMSRKAGGKGGEGAIRSDQIKSKFEKMKENGTPAIDSLIVQCIQMMIASFTKHPEIYEHVIKGNLDEERVTLLMDMFRNEITFKIVKKDDKKREPLTDEEVESFVNNWISERGGERIIKEELSRQGETAETLPFVALVAMQQIHLSTVYEIDIEIKKPQFPGIIQPDAQIEKAGAAAIQALLMDMFRNKIMCKMVKNGDTSGKPQDYEDVMQRVNDWVSTQGGREIIQDEINRSGSTLETASFNALAAMQHKFRRHEMYGVKVKIDIIKNQ